MAQPRGTINGHFRVTEQGEMITQNFGHPRIAVNTLDVYTAGILNYTWVPTAFFSSRCPPPTPRSWMPSTFFIPVVACIQPPLCCSNLVWLVTAHRRSAGCSECLPDEPMCALARTGMVHAVVLFLRQPLWTVLRRENSAAWLVRLPDMYVDEENKRLHAFFLYEVYKRDHSSAVVQQ